MAKDVKFSIIAANKSAAAFKEIRGGLSSITKSVFSLKTGIAAMVGVGAFSLMAKNADDTADHIQKLSQRLGMSAEALSQYRHVAALSGVTFDTFTMGVQYMQRQLADAADGTGRATKELQKMGVDAAQMLQLAPDQQFESLADSIMSIQDPAERTQAAMKLFGETGVQLIQMMQGGSRGIQDMRMEADDLGMTMGKEMVDNVAAANDSLTKVGESLQAIVEKIVGGASPAIKDLADRVTDWVGANQGLINTGISAFIGGVTEAAQALGPMISVIGDDMGKWFNANQAFISQDVATFLEDLFTIGQEIIPVFNDVAGVFESVGKWIGQTAAEAANLYDKLSNMSALQTLQSGWNWLTGSGGGSSSPAPGSAEAVYQASLGGAAPTNTSDQGWNKVAGAFNVVNNFNTQVTRSDAVAISTEAARQAARQ